MLFEQNRERNRQIQIVVRNKDVKEEDVNQLLTQASQATQDIIQKLAGFSDEEDSRVIEKLDEKMKTVFPDAEVFTFKDELDDVEEDEDEKADDQ